MRLRTDIIYVTSANCCFKFLKFHFSMAKNTLRNFKEMSFQIKWKPPILKSLLGIKQVKSHLPAIGYGETFHHSFATTYYVKSNYTQPMEFQAISCKYNARFPYSVSR